LTLIKQAVGADRHVADLAEYEEALLLSYTVDFGFIDSVAVPLLRSTGARVTVVGDVAMADFDPRSAPRAGRTFNAAYAQCAGAFHPKLFVLASDSQARIAIGSGNSTMAGWSYNRELWTVANSSTPENSALIPQLADWLEELSAAVRFSAGVDDRLKNVASLLRRVQPVTTASDFKHRIVSSLAGPILEQLPLGPVDELSVFAPFFDPEAAALSRLIDRLQPATVSVTVQTAMSQFDGGALLSALEGRDAHILDDAETRYRHGKLIEWVKGGQRWALTGSANLSRSALLRSQASGGNCELGVISELPDTLMPDHTTRPPISMIRSIVPPPRSAVTLPAARILGAHLTDVGVRVELVAPLETVAEVQHSTIASREWTYHGSAPTGERTFEIPTLVEAGARLRLVTRRPDSVEFSNVVAVIGLASTVRRRSAAGTSQAAYTIASLFSGALLEKFLADLQDLRRDLQAATPAGPGSTPSDGATENAETLYETTETEIFSVKVGLPMLNFAIGARSEIDELNDENEDEDEETQLEDEDVEESTETFDLQTLRDRDPVTDLAQSTTRARARYRRWARNAVTTLPTLTTTGKLAVVRLIIWMFAAGVWEADEEQACVLLAEALCGLADAPPTPELEASAASLAGVGLAILNHKVPMQRGTPTALATRKARDQIAYLLTVVDQNLVDSYLRYLAEPASVESLGFTLDSDEVMDVATQVVQRDDVEDAFAILIDEGFEVTRPLTRALHVRASTNRPDLVALKAVSYAESAGPMAAWCTTPANKWALVLWRSPDFVVVTGAGRDKPSWQHFQTRRAGLKTVVHAERSDMAGGKRFWMAENMRHTPWLTPVPLGIDLLAELGLPGPFPPEFE
jgi:hypothetical protein